MQQESQNQNNLENLNIHIFTTWLTPCNDFVVIAKLHFYTADFKGWGVGKLRRKRVVRVNTPTTLIKGSVTVNWY